MQQVLIHLQSYGPINLVIVNHIYSLTQVFTKLAIFNLKYPYKYKMRHIKFRSVFLYQLSLWPITIIFYKFSKSTTSWQHNKLLVQGALYTSSVTSPDGKSIYILVF